MTERITVNEHSSVRIQDGAKVVYVDPFHIKGTPHDADYVLITHDHFDHFSTEDIEKVSKPSTILVVPGTMMGKAREVAGAVGDIRMVKQGESGDIDGLAYETVPAYNIGKAFHQKSAGWVGYILMVEGKRIYVAGDTDRTPENEKVVCDIAMIPIGVTYTMDAKEAAGLINVMKPQVAIPIHYGSVAGSKGDAKVFKKHVDSGIQVEIKL